MKRFILILAATLLAFCVVEAKPKQLKPWSEGVMDIHHISTGRGPAIFFILPDGTRMIVDAGDLGDPSRWTHKKIMQALPNESKTPAEWIARYIEHFSKPLNKDLYIDYALITHFDSDHIGYCDHTALTVEGKPYKYIGISHLVNLVPVHTLIDRGYPNYDYPSAAIMAKRNRMSFPNYKLMVEERDRLGLKNEQFKVGSSSQLVLKNGADKYPSFSIQNVAGNGLIWSGKGTATRAIADQYPKGHLNENSSSCVFRLNYGNFAYYMGGDISGGYSKKGVTKAPWNDMQSAVAKVIGKVDVALADHHGYADSMNENLLKALKTNVIVLPVWDLYHPHPKAMKRIVDNGVPFVYPAGITDARLKELQEKGLAGPIREDGHIVIRVFKGGKKYQVFVLNDRSLDYEIIAKSKVFTAKGNNQ